MWEMKLDKSKWSFYSQKSMVSTKSVLVKKTFLQISAQNKYIQNFMVILTRTEDDNIASILHVS